MSLPASSVSGIGNITLQYKELKTIGDANGDGVVNVADAVSLVNYILQKPSENFVLAAADVNGDNLINVADVVSIVKLILGQSSSARRRSAIQEATTNDRLTLACSDQTLTLNLENQTQFVAAQFDVHIPDGQKIEGISLADRTTELQLSYERIDNNAYRVLLYSLGNGVITGESGELLKMKLSDPVSEVIVDNIQFVTDN